MSEGGRFRQMLLFEDGVRNERATEDKRGKLLSVLQGLGGRKLTDESEGSKMGVGQYGRRVRC